MFQIRFDRLIDRPSKEKIDLNIAAKQFCKQVQEQKNNTRTSRGQ
jgi:hypothetical protein